MAATNYFDVVLVGDDLAGLTAAALLSHRGFRVLRLRGEAAPESYKLGRYALPTSPMAFTGLESPAVRRIASALNLVQLLRRKLIAQRPAYQLVLPDARLDVTDSTEQNQRELQRELGEAAASAFDAYLLRAQEVGRVLDAALGQDHTLLPEGFWERRELGRWEQRLQAATDQLLDGLPEGSPLWTAAHLPAALFASLAPWSPTASTLARHDELGRRGTFRLDGGREALRELIEDHLNQTETRPYPASRIVLRRGRVTGVEAGPRNEPFGTNYVLYASPIAELPKLVDSDDGPPKRVEERMAQTRVAGYRYVLNAVVTVGGIPEGIASLVLATRDTARPLVADNALAVHVGEPDEEGHVVVSATCVLPAPEGASAADPEAAANLARSARPNVEARLAELMPFWEGHRVLLHSPHDGLAPVGVSGEPAAPLPMEEVYSTEAPTSLGIGMIPHGGLLKHLVLASRQNFPGLGVEGELAAAWGAAKAIAASEKKKDFLSSEVLLTRA
jgi:hypothetical protein